MGAVELQRTMWDTAHTTISGFGVGEGCPVLLLAALVGLTEQS